MKGMIALVSVVVITVVAGIVFIGGLVFVGPNESLVIISNYGEPKPAEKVLGVLENVEHGMIRPRCIGRENNLTDVFGPTHISLQHHMPIVLLLSAAACLLLNRMLPV